MTDIALTEWEHQPHVLNVLTSREMGAWLGRRDNRLLQEIRQEIFEYKDDKIIHEERNEMIDIILEIIDKHISEDTESVKE